MKSAYNLGGYLDGVAIYGRFIDAEEAAKKYTFAAARLRSA
jgi:hypothetical protein